MAKEKTRRKEKPSIETVKAGLRASDFLKVKLCNPIMEKLDKIEICQPNIVELCTPNMCLPDFKCYPERRCYPHFCIPNCNPYCTPNCNPGICTPICAPNCIPVCIPVISGEWDEPCAPGGFEIPEKYRGYRVRAGARTMAEGLTLEMKEMFEELRKIRVEIEGLKKKVK